MRTLLLTFIAFAMMLTSLPAQDLTGRVTDEAGEPIIGALIAIYTARQRVGPGVL
jgi:hypothetical protein